VASHSYSNTSGFVVMYATNHATAFAPEGLPNCRCVGCTASRPTMHCPLTRARGGISAPLPIDFRKVGTEIWPPCWWNGRIEGHEVEDGWAGGRPEDAALPTPQGGPSTMDDGDVMGDRLPSIHKLGLWGLRRTSAIDRQPEPLDNTSSSPGTTISSHRLDTPDWRGAVHHQLPSQSNQTNIVPEQDSPSNAQGESSRNNCEMESERNHGGGSSSLKIRFIHFDNNGNRSTWIDM
jgi:hypothetical protein